jgi:hypothetical protein
MNIQSATELPEKGMVYQTPELVEYDDINVLTQGDAQTEAKVASIAIDALN